MPLWRRANPYLTKHIICFFRKGEEVDQQYTDEHGVVRSKMTGCDSIFVLHTLFPDAMTMIKEKGDSHNYFELGLNPSLAGVSFKGVVPRLDHDSITLEMPWLFEMKDEWAYAAKKAGATDWLLADNSWMVYPDTCIKMWLLTGPVLKARVEVKVRSRDTATVKEYALPFSL